MYVHGTSIGVKKERVGDVKWDVNFIFMGGVHEV
jgi:hypothetical protein